MSPPTNFNIGIRTGAFLLKAAQSERDAGKIIEEIAQNLMDQGAKKGLIIITPAKGGRVDGYDDGIGTTPEKYQEEWQNVGWSSKEDDPTAGGQYGTAKIYPYAFCENGKLTSRDRLTPGSGYFSFTMNRKELLEDVPKMQWEWEKTGFTLKSGKLKWKPTSRITYAGWSKIAMRRLQHIDQIAEMIGEKYSELLKRTQCDIWIVFRPKGLWNNADEKRVQVKPIEFIGTRLEHEELKFRTARVSVDLRSTFKEVPDRIFLANSRGVRINCINLPMDPIAKAVLCSGHYNGVFFDQGAEFDDRRFSVTDKPINNNIVEAIERYVLDNLVDYLDYLKSQDHHRRIAEAIRQEVNILEAFIQNDPTLQLQLRDELQGLVSGSHTDANLGAQTQRPFRNKPPKLQDFRDRQQLEKSGNKKRKRGEQKKRIHSSAEHPDGKQRHIVGDQFGLTVKYQEAPVHLRRKITWIEHGIIYFNSAHPQFTEWMNSKLKSAFPKFVRLHLHKVVAGLLRHKDERENFEKAFDETFSDMYLHN